MPREDNKTKYNHGVKSMKIPFTVYADLESLLKKIATCHNNPKKSSATKINKYILSGYSLFTHYSVDTAKKLDYYTGKVCMKNFCKDLKEHATKITHYEKKGNDTTDL